MSKSIAQDHGLKPERHMPSQLNYSDACVDKIAAYLTQTKAETKRGVFKTPLPDVDIFWGEVSIARSPLVYEPGIAVVLSGQKVGFLNDRRFTYNATQYLAVGLPVSFECETEASVETPLVALFLRADLGVVSEIAVAAGLLEPTTKTNLPITAVDPVPVNQKLKDAVSRLCGYFSNPTEARLLGPQTLREIFYHALQDVHGRVLLAQTMTTRPESRIAALLRRKDLFGTESVEHLAEQAGMSPPSFYRHFKAVTGQSPKKYFQRQRLFKAKSLLVFEGASVAEAARHVGYVSPSQFSREFRDLFGLPPSRATEFGSNYDFD